MIPDISKRKNLTLVAFDPGVTTGVATFENGEYRNSYHLNETDLEKFCKARLKWSPQPDYIIIESFRIYAHKAQSLINDPMVTPQIIGKLKVWFDGYTIVEQSAAQAKGFFKAERLKEMGIWPKNRHERDAVKHALFGLYFNKEVK